MRISPDQRRAAPPPQATQTRRSTSSPRAEYHGTNAAQNATARIQRAHPPRRSNPVHRVGSRSAMNGRPCPSSMLNVRKNARDYNRVPQNDTTPKFAEAFPE
jgi:hypothetical protein